MPRSTSLSTDLLSTRALQFVDCVKIELSAGTLLYTNNSADVSITGLDGSTTETYLTGNGYLYHSALTTTAQAQAERVHLVFDALTVDSTATAPGPAFANADTTGASVTITKVEIDSAGVGVTFVAFKGIVDNFSIKVTDKESLLTVFCGGKFANFEKTSLYGYTTTSSQNKLYPLDTGFEFAANKHTNIRWEE